MQPWSHGDGRTVLHRAPQLRDPRPIQRMMAPSLNSCSGLFPRAHARSDDPEADDGPDTARPPAEPPIHPFTGRFADSEHTVAYRSKVFRMMMPLHVVAMALVICAGLFVLFSDVVRKRSSGDARLLAPAVVITATLVLGVGARVAVHRWKDRAKAQELGAMAWKVTIVSNVFLGIGMASMEHAHPTSFCRTSGLPVFPLIAALSALVNATHGMEFWHTTLLVGLMLCNYVAWRIACGDLLALNLAIILLVRSSCIPSATSIRCSVATLSWRPITSTRRASGSSTTSSGSSAACTASRPGSPPVARRLPSPRNRPLQLLGRPSRPPLQIVGGERPVPEDWSSVKIATLGR